MKKILVSALLLTGAVLSATAQNTETKKPSFFLGGDLVSSYVWRGAYTSGTSLQPAMGLKYGDFALSAWGSADISGLKYKEVDFTASYSLKGFTLALTDYWWSGEGAYNYFCYKNDETGHLFEGTLGYKLPFEKFPMEIRWNTLFAGADTKNDDGDACYSTYIEAGYPFSVAPVDLNLSLGVTPWKGMYSDDFAVVNIGLKASKTIDMTDELSMPVSCQVIANPDKEDIFFVLGIGILID